MKGGDSPRRKKPQQVTQLSHPLVDRNVLENDERDDEVERSVEILEARHERGVRDPFRLEILRRLGHHPRRNVEARDAPESAGQRKGEAPHTATEIERASRRDDDSSFGEQFQQLPDIRLAGRKEVPPPLLVELP